MFGLDKSTLETIEKQSSRFYKILKNSLKIKKENILIISDYGVGENKMAAMLGYGYYFAAKKKGLNVNILFQEPKKGFMFADSHVVEAVTRLEKNNIVIVTVSNKLGRFGEEKSFRTFCADREHRFLSATGLGDVRPDHFDLFLEAMNVNYSRMKKHGLAIKKLWDKATEIRVKTEAGTDITFDVSGMEAIANIGEYHELGKGGNMPAGEVYIPPKGFEGVNGKVVIDGSMKTEDGAILLESPVTLYIEKGKVVRMEGNQAHLLEQTFQRFEDRAKYPERIRLVGELGIGINPGAVLIGSMIMDEKVLGTAHIAIGSNYWFGGEIKTIYHGDQVFKNPIFYVDGKKMEI
ncbi:MAG TPA: aminopeptidase [Candidatus Nanoarchaeia archaeon]|nr:aminopeptidase [Candidatus Nanoarchaeia archaeon]